VLEDAEIERILVIGAHPDDVDFGVAGTTAGWVAKGIQVSYCIVTDGDAGGFDPATPRTEIPRIRRGEQTDAGAIVGVKDIHFLGYRDGELVVSMDLRRDISRVIRQVRPQRVVCQSPERFLDRIAASHPDHLAAGEASLCAVYPDSRNPFAHTTLLEHEGLEAWTVSEVWLSAHPTPNHYVDVTDTFDQKLAAVHAHISQHPHPEGLEPRLRDWGTTIAAMGGLPEGRLAEAFRVINTA
jgi:LmbE family N-acetylglucosaminyl deacetylase